MSPAAQDRESALLDAARRMIAGAGTARAGDSEHRFVELVTFASAAEILAMYDVLVAEDFLGLAPWARNLAFRLACLQAPRDAELKRRAATDLRAFGPDFDAEADRLEREAAELEAGS